MSARASARLIGRRPQQVGDELLIRRGPGGRILESMAVSTPTRRSTLRARPAAVRASPPVARRPESVDLESLSAAWQRAFDAAGGALGAATGSLTDLELRERQTRLRLEREGVAQLLADVAGMTRAVPAPWLSPVPVTNAMLGLPATVRACLFDVEGVLTDSGRVHAVAWGDVFDEFLMGVGERTTWPFIPFDRRSDYASYLDGRPRLEGIHLFLASRGIQIAEGRPGDPADADTAHGLARRKGRALERRLNERGVAALPGARRYLEAARRAGLALAVVSASTNTLPILEIAGLAPLIGKRIDAAAIREEALRSRPAPDLLLAGCRRLGLLPAEAVTFTHTPAGVAAGRSAGLTVIGVGDGAEAESLQGFGADRVTVGLEDLLDRRLRSAADRRL
jgi:HAD superfamily hydrolase (TIGR01509 family)